MVYDYLYILGGESRIAPHPHPQKAKMLKKMIVFINTVFKSGRFYKGSTIRHTRTRALVHTHTHLSLIHI